MRSQIGLPIRNKMKQKALQEWEQAKVERVSSRSVLGWSEAEREAWWNYVELVFFQDISEVDFIQNQTFYEIANREALNQSFNYPLAPASSPSMASSILLKERLEALIQTPYAPIVVECPAPATAQAGLEKNTIVVSVKDHKYEIPGQPPARDVLYMERPILFSTFFSEPAGSETHHVYFESNHVKPFCFRDRSPCHYDLYVPKSFYQQQKPVAVIFRVYGGGETLPYRRETTLCTERILTQWGCIVAVLRGEAVLHCPEEEDSFPAESEHYRINDQNFPDQLFEDIEAFYTYLSLPQKKGGCAEKPYILPETPVFFMGESFGGMVGLRIAAHPRYQKLFQAYLIHAPVTDFSLGIASEPWIKAFDFSRKDKTRPNSQYTFYFAKNCFYDSSYNQEVSPLYAIQHVQSPIFLSHGTLDSIVPLEHSLQWVQRANLSGKGHWVKTHWMEGRWHALPPAKEDWVEFKKLHEAYFIFIQEVVQQHKLAYERRCEGQG